MRTSLRPSATHISLVLLGIWAPPDAQAIIIRHDVADTDYVVADEDYPALVDLFEPGDCIGTLIDPSVLLTVAHCAEDMTTSQTLQAGGVPHDVEEIILHPDWRGWNNDIALVRLSTPVSGVTPLPIYRGSDELGETLILVGRGLHGTGLEGEPGASEDPNLRRATNVVSQVSPQWIEVHFEAPGEDGITDLEGVGASGDSGGPAFLQTADGVVLAGLNSWGEGPGSIRVGQYGAQDYSTRVSQFAEWIDGELGTTAPADTGTADTGTLDTGLDEQIPTSPDGSKESAGCGCASNGTGAGWYTLIAGMGLLIRRRA